MIVDVTNECDVVRSPRVVQIAGMFDVTITDKSIVHFEGEIPIENRDWNIGLIVGPSGSGKSSVARQLFGERLIIGFDWPNEASILDGFPPGVSIKQITALLNAVGFGAVPNWLRPYHVLSNGEQFRVTVARALAEQSDLVVIDEFTSVVDRQVAQVASHSVQKAVRKSGRRLIAVACHYDIVEWLQPDWVYEPHLAAFEWRSVQRRPALSLEIRSVGREVWDRFSRYHYLSAELSTAAFCVAGFIDGRCIAFCAIKKFSHPTARNLMAEHRTVVLPDYQGLGLSRALTEWIGLELWQHGWRFHAVTSHPAIIAQKAASPRWRMINHGIRGASRKSSAFSKHQQRFTSTRLSAAFCYTAPVGTATPHSPDRGSLIFARG